VALAIEATRDRLGRPQAQFDGCVRVLEERERALVGIVVVAQLLHTVRAHANRQRSIGERLDELLGALGTKAAELRDAITALSTSN
jgi:hypothetical protein